MNDLLHSLKTHVMSIYSTGKNSDRKRSCIDELMFIQDGLDNIMKTTQEYISKLKYENQWIMTPPARRTFNTYYTTDRIPLTEKLYLDAKKIRKLNQMTTPGDLYYIESMDHFAIKIGDILLHGNIGMIDNNAKKSIKACRNNKCTDITKCQFYHDPLLYDGSTNIRNYNPQNWTYMPRNFPYKKMTSHGKDQRHFGSRNNLETDILFVNKDDVNLFADQVMHDLLCIILLKKYYKMI